MITRNISENTKIAPMLLLPFIENSFKHGAMKNGVLSIKIKIGCHDKSIYFYIENISKDGGVSNKGIGLENMQKRLNLLYKDNYSLRITNSQEVFKAELILTIT